MRQFTLACAICGSALFAWPASRRVATQVVRIVALYIRVGGKPRDGVGDRRVFQNGFHVRGDLAAFGLDADVRNKRA